MIAALISAIWPYLLAGLGALAALLGVYAKGRSDARAKAEYKAMKGAISAKEEQLEMHREATKAERDAAALASKEAYKEALRWAKR